MTEPAFVDSFLINQFREFYEAVIALKARYAQGGPELAGALAQGSMALSEPIVRLLKEQELSATRYGGQYGARIYKEAQYAMAALADEIFLHLLEWRGRGDWQQALVEQRLFNSSLAGERIFERIDLLLRDRNDPSFPDLAAVYYQVLSLGFLGKYRLDGDVGAVETYRRELYLALFQHKPDLSSEDKSLFPEAFAHTLGESEGAWLGDPKPWYYAIAAVTLILIINSVILWESVSSDLAAVTQQILAQP
jgi:type VI secretion system protein ImpK